MTEENSAVEQSKEEIETRERHFLILLGTIISLEIVEVVLGPALTHSRLVGLLQLLVIGVTIYAVGGRRNLTIAALLLGGPVVIARVLSVSITTKEAEVVGYLFGLIFLAYVVWVIAASVLRAGRVTTDKIYGAICIYLLLGILWGYAYCVLEIARPGSFHFPDRTSPTELAEQNDFRQLEYELKYYSYVTLTTLGYGDITPVTRQARQLSWLEALLGQLFIAITIARLVGTQLAHSREHQN